MNIVKSAGSIIAAFIVVVILSLGTDLAMKETGLLKLPFQDNSVAFIIFVILYRSLYGVVGAYITASLAPSRPMLHAMVVGGIGFIVGIAGAIIMKNEGPTWYAVSIILIAFPTSWVGANLKIRSSSKH